MSETIYGKLGGASARKKLSGPFICPICTSKLEFLGGEPAHEANLYCPKCNWPEEPAAQQDEKASIKLASDENGESDRASPATSAATSETQKGYDWIAYVIRDLCEMPGYDSPPDFPEGIVCTSDEIRHCIEENSPVAELERERDKLRIEVQSLAKDLGAHMKLSGELKEELARVKVALKDLMHGSNYLPSCQSGFSPRCLCLKCAQDRAAQVIRHWGVA